MSKPDDSADWRPGASLQALEARAGLLRRIRTFFEQRGVLEVETPVLSAAGNSDPGITQFQLRSADSWLRTSPEYAMKRLLAAGSPDIYELGRVFRAGESGRHHNAEFTMLEWYRKGWTSQQLMDEVVQLVRACLPDHAFNESRVSYRKLFLGYTGLDPLSASADQFRQWLGQRQDGVPELRRMELLDLVISCHIQPALPKDGLTLVYDYPAEQAALARLQPHDPSVADRFELFLGRFELANGYRELTGAGEQESRFSRENQQRIDAGQAAVPVDTLLLEAMRNGLPDCSGVALGVDRLLMFMLGAQSLDEVMAFAGRRA
jgi:lysyl-tRNA synthetase class 2